MLHFGAKGAKPPYWPQKVSDKSLKQAVSPRRPLFGCSHPQQRAQEQAQVKASRRNLVSLSQILFSPERGPAHSAFIKDVLEAISAKTEAGPCVTHVGPDGAGHFVKMVHNGIEYGEIGRAHV